MHVFCPDLPTYNMSGARLEKFPGARAVDPDRNPHGSAFILPPGSGSAFRKTHGTAKNVCGSTALTGTLFGPKIHGLNHFYVEIQGIKVISRPFLNRPNTCKVSKENFLYCYFLLFLLLGLFCHQSEEKCRRSIKLSKNFEITSINYFIIKNFIVNLWSRFLYVQIKVKKKMEINKFTLAYSKSPFYFFP